MAFWKLCYNKKIVDIDTLRQVVITVDNQYGYLTKDEFKEITGIEFK